MGNVGAWRLNLRTNICKPVGFDRPEYILFFYDDKQCGKHWKSTEEMSTFCIGRANTNVNVGKGVFFSDFFSNQNRGRVVFD